MTPDLQHKLKYKFQKEIIMNVVKSITAAVAAVVLAATMGCSAIPGAPVTDGGNMGWNASNQNG